MLSEVFIVTLAESPSDKVWWQYVIEQAFGLTILLIFLLALLGVLFKQWHKDKCLKLLHGFHVCYANTAGRVVWGDLKVYSKGIELDFDAPHHSEPEITKTSVLVYETQMADCLAICRDTRGLSAKAKRKREKQIKRSFRPGPIRRTVRWSQNLINTFRDAFNKSLNALIGQMTQSRQDGVIANQSEEMLEIGDTLLGVAGNAYEPILERHIGQPVILELNNPASPPAPSVEIPGYLVDYTGKYLAVFNVEHRGFGSEEINIADEKISRPGYTAELINGRLRVTCLGPDFLCVLSIQSETHYSEPNVVLPQGAKLELSMADVAKVNLVVEQTRRVDVVCPRSQATIRFGGMYVKSDKRVNRVQKAHGIAPNS